MEKIEHIAFRIQQTAINKRDPEFQELANELFAAIEEYKKRSRRRRSK